MMLELYVARGLSVTKLVTRAKTFFEVNQPVQVVTGRIDETVSYNIYRTVIAFPAIKEPSKSLCKECSWSGHYVYFKACTYYKGYSKTGATMDLVLVSSHK